MHLYQPRFFACLAFGAVLAMAFSVVAQQEPVIFSRPTDNKNDKTTSSMLEPASKLEGRADEFNAPKRLFDLSPTPDLPAPPMPIISSQSLRDELNKRENWTLMTPEEILGVPTPEKILGLPDPTGDDKRTQEERYLHRQEMAASTSATNALRRQDSSLFRDDSNPFDQRNQRADNNRFSKTDTRPDTQPEVNSRKFFDRLVAAPANSPFGGNQNADSPWANSFGQPAPLTKPNVDQMAAMDRFRALMEPSAPEATRASAVSLPVTDPNMEPATLFNPLGQSYAPLQNSLGRPTGITPLPGLTGSEVPSVAPKKSLVQVPPWLSKDPQPLDGSFSKRTW